MTHKDDDSEIFSKNILDWLTRVGAIATALATIIGVFFPGDEAKRVAFAVAILLAIGSVAVFYYQRHRAARYKIAEPLEPLAPSAALRGLLPFEEGDQLPGRARDVQELYTLVASNAFRFGVLWGASGCGKTSLLRAGLVPTLRQKGFLPLYIPKPTKDPQDALRAALVRVLPGDSRDSLQRQLRIQQNNLARLEEQKARHGMDVPIALLNEIDVVREEIARLTGLLDKLAGKATVEDLREMLHTAAPAQKSVVVIFDQFEEFFLTNRTRPSQASFVQWLGECVADAGLPVVFLVGIRADFFAQLQNLHPNVPEPTSPRTTYQLQNFDTEQAKQIFAAAAKSDAIPFEPALIDAVVGDLESEGIVRPAELQIVGTRLKRKNIFNVNKYEIAGRARGILSSYIADEIKQSANEQVARLVLRLMTADAVEAKSATDLSLDDILRDIGAIAGARETNREYPEPIRRRAHPDSHGRRQIQPRPRLSRAVRARGDRRDGDERRARESPAETLRRGIQRRPQDADSVQAVARDSKIRDGGSKGRREGAGVDK